MVATGDLLASPTLSTDGANCATLLKKLGIADPEAILLTESPVAHGPNKPSQGRPADCGKLLVEQLLGPIPEKWPEGGWRAMVEEEVGRKLPVEPWLYHKLMKSKTYWKDHITEASGPLPTFISACLDMEQCNFGSKYMTMCWSNHFISQFIVTIKQAARRPPYFHYDEERYAAPTPSASLPSEGGMRQIWNIVLEGRLVGTGQDRAIGGLPIWDLAAAVLDVLETAPVCNSPQYLPVDGTFAYAAAGHNICFIFLDLNGKVTYMKEFDTSSRLGRAQLLNYVAGIYRALLVAQKCFKANGYVYKEDARNVWQRRPNDCRVMCCNDKQGRRFIKEWQQSVLHTYLKGRRTNMASFRQVHALGNGSNGIAKAKLCTLNSNMIIVEMELYGPNLRQAPPQDEQSFKAVCRGLLGALALLHENNLVHCGIKGSNVVWIDDVRRDAVVLVDLDTACEIDTAMPKDAMGMFWPDRWDHDTLDMQGRYGTASDVHEVGKLLKSLLEEEPDAFWSKSAAEFCENLYDKRLTVSEALGHLYWAT